MTKANVREFNVRRSERFETFIEKLKDFISMSEEYKCDESNKLLVKVANTLQKSVVKVKSNGENVSDSTNFFYSLDVEDKNKESFIEKIISDIREAGEYLIEIELKESKKNLMDTYFYGAIEEVEDFARPKYEQAIKSLVQLAKIKKVKMLNNDVWEMEKDLTACISYNEKIKNATQVEDEKLSDEFVENALKECVEV